MFVASKQSLMRIVCILTVLIALSVLRSLQLPVIRHLFARLVVVTAVMRGSVLRMFPRLNAILSKALHGILILIAVFSSARRVVVWLAMRLFSLPLFNARLRPLFIRMLP